MIFAILTIIAVWIFDVPFAWQVTLTIFASIHLLLWVIGVLDIASERHEF